MPVSLELIEIFRAVAEHEGFTQAGVRLGLSQQVVSKKIRALEATMGVMLFRRSTRAVSLTEAGRVLYAESQAGYEALRNAIARAQESNALAIPLFGLFAVNGVVAAAFLIQTLRFLAGVEHLTHDAAVVALKDGQAVGGLGLGHADSGVRILRRRKYRAATKPACCEDRAQAVDLAASLSRRPRSGHGAPRPKAPVGRCGLDATKVVSIASAVIKSLLHVHHPGARPGRSRHRTYFNLSVRDLGACCTRPRGSVSGFPGVFYVDEFKIARHPFCGGLRRSDGARCSLRASGQHQDQVG